VTLTPLSLGPLGTLEDVRRALLDIQAWSVRVALGDLQGATGPEGPAGPMGPQGAAGPAVPVDAEDVLPGTFGDGTGSYAVGADTAGGAAGFTPFIYANGLRLGGGTVTDTIYHGTRNIGITREPGGQIYLGQATVSNVGLLVDTTTGAESVTGPERVAGSRSGRARVVTTNVTLDDLDSLVLVDASAGSVVVTLPAASTARAALAGRVVARQYVVKRLDNSVNSVTVVPSAPDAIDGAASVSLATQWALTRLQAHPTGSLWLVV